MALGTTLTHLSLLLRLQGRRSEAEDAAQQAFHEFGLAGPRGEVVLWLAAGAREKILGSDHPTVARLLEAIAFLLEARGSYAEAMGVWRRIVEILERSRPAGSLDVASSLEAYAMVLAKAGRDADARTMEARAAAIRGR